MSKLAMPTGGRARSIASLTRRAFAAHGLAAMLPAAGRAAANLNVIAGINAFGHNLFQRRLTDPAKNTALSPLSLGLCVAMTASGSAGATAAEFETALHLPPGSCAQLPDASHALSQALKNVAGLSLASALAFENKEDLFRPDYVARMRDSFGGEILMQATAPEVNAWVSEKTRGMIPHIVEQIGIFALINALHFKRAWPSPAAKVKDGTFITGRGEKITVMRMKKAAGRGLALPNARTFILPYRDSTAAMIIVLPTSGQQAAQVSLDLPSDIIQRVLSSSKSSLDFDYLLMPPFQLNAHVEMGAEFRELGLLTMFDPVAADFSGMKAHEGLNLYVDQVIHRCAIDVNQSGTEAAAASATVFQFTGGSRFGHEGIVEVDRPFMFYLVDQSTGAVLMQGCVNDPRSSVA